MFYSEELLTNKNGALSVIWLAATLGQKTKRITKRDLNNIDFPKTCELIAEPPEPMALRLSGSLLVGVARVYHRNYDMFYTDVNEFHTTLRRSLTFDTTAVGATGGTTGIDLPGGGKSKTDHITFDDIDISWRSVIDVDFTGIDWRNPFNKRPRRQLSVLSSLPSQQTPHYAEDPDRTRNDEEEEEYEPGEGRSKRPKVTSSPFHARPKKDSTILRPSQGSTGLARPEEEIILPDDFNLLHELNPGDSSFDIHDGLGLDMGDLGPPGNIDDFLPMDLDLTGAAPPDGDAQGDNIWANGQAAVAKAPRTRKKKRVAVDQVIELPEGTVTEEAYNTAMNAAQAAARLQEANKANDAMASEMVDGAGKWVDFFHPEMKAFFATITKAGTFQWEHEVIAHKAGRAWTPANRNVALHANATGDQALVDENPFAPGGDPNTSGDMSFDPGYFDNGGGDMPGVGGDIPPVTGTPRNGNVDAVEAARAGRRMSRKEPLPWEGPQSVKGNDDLPVAAGFGFTPGSSLRLSIMTPQEVRIRKMMRSSSGNNPHSSMRPREARSRSGSVLARGKDEAAMLIDGQDDDELPRESQLDITESQAMDRDDIPDAFQPEMLATLETQCRQFLTYVEDRAGENQTEIDFDDIVPVSSSVQVAAIAFYNCLTLVTKRLLTVDQPDAWGPITISLAA